MRPVVARFPAARLRRLRASPALRAMVRQATLSPADFIWPLFVMDGRDEAAPIASMPGVSRLTVDRIAVAAKRAEALGIPAICIFPYTPAEARTEGCEMAWDMDNIANRAIRAAKDAAPGVAVMTDIALDPYNASGQDGYVRGGQIVNDETVEALVRMALAQACSGADILGPSDMMDGRIGAIRTALESEGHQDVAILSYAAKYASAFYGPFRDAVGASAALKGDKTTYQMDPGNSDEALRLVERDLQEGADMVMVKPGMAYLDICHRVKQAFGAPTFAYQVSGEYAMLRAAMAAGWLDETAGMLESLMAFRRAGCSGVLSYFAHDAARALGARG